MGTGRAWGRGWGVCKKKSVNKACALALLTDSRSFGCAAALATSVGHAMCRCCWGSCALQDRGCVWGCPVTDYSLCYTSLSLSLTHYNSLPLSRACAQQANRALGESQQKLWDLTPFAAAWWEED